MDDFEEDIPYVIGKTEGDTRRFYRNRPMATNYANDGFARWPDQVVSVAAAFEPLHGFVPILYTTGPIPEAHYAGYEVKDFTVPAAPEKTPDDWASKKKPTPRTSDGSPATPRAEGSRRPSRGKTLRAWEIFDSMPDASRKERVAACVAEGLDPSTASTQHSRWAKEQK